MNRSLFTARRPVDILLALFVIVLAATGFSAGQTPPTRIELEGRAEIPVGTTARVARDVSQWVCLQQMPSSTVVPVSAALSDRAEATRSPAGDDVTEWFSLASAEISPERPGVTVALHRVDHIWDVTPTFGGGVAFRVFCRVTVEVTPRSDAGVEDVFVEDDGDEVLLDVRIENLGGYAFPVRYPLRIVPQ